MPILGIRVTDEEKELILNKFKNPRTIKAYLLECKFPAEDENILGKLDEILSIVKKKKTASSTKGRDRLIDIGFDKDPQKDYSENPNYKYIITAWQFWKLFRLVTIESGSRTTVIDKAFVEDWSNEVRLMIVKKETSTDELRLIYLWLKKRESKQSKFWAKNIKSTSTLREKYPRLLEEMKSEEKPVTHVYKREETQRKVYKSSNPNPHGESPIKKILDQRPKQ
jgi:hypothetical protein